MLRNKEVRLLMAGLMIISMIVVLMGYMISPMTSVVVLMVSLLFISATYLFSFWRYREIKKLSAYVRQVSNGKFDLDVRNNQEGELSILRNEIFKVTTMLSEQSAHLHKDKVYLTEAISDISHQLKTPLTSMKMMTDFLNDDTLPDEKKAEFTYTIRTQLERIEWLVSSLLKLSKIDAGTAKFKQERLPVKIVLQKALDVLSIPIDIKGISISMEGNQAVSFTGDVNWTVEAFVNILKNCVEYTPEQGCIKIRYLENPLFTEVVIADNGEGISKKDIPYIFKRFYKGKEASENSVGIGLAMAYSIIAEQNGHIKVESDQESGTTFTIKFYRRLTGSKTPTN